MDKLKVTFTMALMMLAIINSNMADLPKSSYARTMLKVSRSLPGETEERKVLTSEGNVATLIIKRRDKSSPEQQTPNEPPNIFQNPQNPTSATLNENVTSSNVLKPAKLEPKTKEDVRKLEEAQIEKLRAKLSDSERQKNFSKHENVSTDERANVTEKVRPVNEGNIDYGNWTPLGTDGRAVHLEESTTEEVYQSWKPVQSDLKTTTEERTNYARFDAAFPAGGLLLPRHFQDRSQRKLLLADQAEEKPRHTFLPHQIRSSRTNIGANVSKNRDGKNVPAEVVIRSEINVKSSSKRSPMTLDTDGTPVIHGKRVPDEPMDKVQTWRNARVINNKLIHSNGGGSGDSLDASSSFYPAENVVEKQTFERFFKNVNRRYGKDYEEEGKNVYFEWDPKNYKNEALNAEVYESKTENYRSTSHKRMLHPDGVSVYPVSQLYTPESQKIAPVALKPGARAPVLQYAHPELGVQPAKILKNEKRRPDNFPENQYSFTEQRQKKKYVLNDKNIVDSYTTKNYYPNQHFYGLKRPNDAPFWVKISENLKNQFSSGVEKMSQLTRPVIDPLVEATHKISQNLGLSKGKEAEDKIGTVTSGGSILIPALGLVASGAALGIGAVAVGRYLDVDVLKRSNEALGTEVEYQRALDASQPSYSKETDRESRDEGLDRMGKYGETVYFLENVPRNEETRNSYNDNKSSSDSQNGVLLIVEGDDGSTGNGEMKSSIERNERESSVSRRRRRSLNYLDIFQAEGNLKNLIRDKRFQRKGADSISEIVEIDFPARERNVDVTGFLIPSRNVKDRKKNKDSAVLIIEDGPLGSFQTNLADRKNLERVVENLANVEKNSVDGRNERRRRSIESDQELEDALQNLENAEVAEVAHIDGDWTNTPCAKRIFCDAMIQRGADAVILMEKKMAALLGLIQPGAAVQVSSHFQQIMDAVRRHDCSSFLCPQARPGNVFF